MVKKLTGRKPTTLNWEALFFFLLSPLESGSLQSGHVMEQGTAGPSSVSGLSVGAHPLPFSRWNSVPHLWQACKFSDVPPTSPGLLVKTHQAVTLCLCSYLSSKRFSCLRSKGNTDRTSKIGLLCSERKSVFLHLKRCLLPSPTWLCLESSVCFGPVKFPFLLRLDLVTSILGPTVHSNGSCK